MFPKNSEAKSKNNKHVVGFAVKIFVVVLIFTVGTLFGLQLSRNNSGEEQVLNLGKQVQDSTTNFDVGYLDTVYQTLEQNYIGELPDKQQITYGMAEGLMRALDDQYSGFLNPEQAEEYMNQASSEYEGIGVRLGFNGQYTQVVTPIKGHPGIKAGLKAGDSILEVNGEDLTGVRPEVAANKIRGEAGTTVKIKVYRQSKDEVLAFDIKRAVIDLDNVKYEKLGQGIFQVDIAQFTEGSENGKTGSEVFNQQWRNVVDAIVAQNPKGIVLDLRNNPGGFVDSVRYVTDEFVPKGKIILQEKEKNQSKRVYRAQRDGAFEDVPVVLLVNQASASSSEILAAAFQAHDVGPVVGQQTVGKGVEQRLVRMQDDSLLLVVFRSWLKPNGEQISEENPITPDHEVKYEAAPNSDKYDTQVQKALQLLRKSN